MNRPRSGQLIFLLAALFSTTALGNPNPAQEPQTPASSGAKQTDNSQNNQGEPGPGFDFRAAEREFLAIGKPPDPEAVKRGQAIYVPTCGFCHGSAGRGGSAGPSLVRSVLVLHDQGTGKEIIPVVRDGRPDKGMPAFPLKEEQVKDIAAFLLSLVQANANRNDYVILNVVTGDASKGETYFKNRCASCHSPTGDLAHIAGKFDPVALQSRFLFPRGEWYPGMPPRDPREVSTATIKLASGKTYSGKVDKIDDFSVSIIETSGERRSWVLENEPGITVEVSDPLKAHLELLRQYSDDDMRNILAYLVTLK